MEDEKFCLNLHDSRECANCDGFNSKCNYYESKKTRKEELRKMMDSIKRK